MYRDQTIKKQNTKQHRSFRVYK